MSVGSSYNYGADDQTEFLCVVSKELNSPRKVEEDVEATDRVKVRKFSPNPVHKSPISLVSCLKIPNFNLTDHLIVKLKISKPLFYTTTLGRLKRGRTVDPNV